MHKNKLYPFLIGNFLELFEFSLYGIFSKEFSNIFFKDVGQGTFYSLSIFASGFLARPVGGIIFGHIGDKYGRRVSLILSITLMSLSTLGIATLPLPEKIGIFAPLLLLMFRLLQGISCGGEYIGLTILLFEKFTRRPGLAGAYAATSGMSGSLAAIFVSYLSVSHVLSSWFWRIPFLMSALLGFITIFLRIKVIGGASSKSRRSQKYSMNYPIARVFKHHPRELLSTFCIGACNGVLTFTLIAYTNIFLIENTPLNLSTALEINFYAVCCFIMSGLFMGWTHDRLRFSPAFYVKAITLGVLVCSFYIYQQLIQGCFSSVLRGEIILASLAGMFSANCNVFMCRLFPFGVRYSGVALGYSLGVCVLGGTGPLICHFFIQLTHSLYMPALYLCVGAMLGIIGCFIGEKISFVSESRATRRY